MFEGLLTWNWNLWYKLNTLLGVTFFVASIAFFDDPSLMASFVYTAIYAVLWLFNILSDGKV